MRGIKRSPFSKYMQNLGVDTVLSVTPKPEDRREMLTSSCGISLKPWIFTTQQVNHDIFKYSYLRYGNVIGWNRECDK